MVACSHLYLLDLLFGAVVVNSLGAMHGYFLKYVKCHFFVFQACS